jgi:hypothetical protein
MVGARTGELLTYQGQVLVHDNKAELEFLVPKARVVRVTDGDLGQPVLELRHHPGMAKVQFPLRRQDFPGG